MHWDRFLTCGVRVASIFLGFLSIWIAVLLTRYLFTIVQDAHYLKTIVEDFVKDTILVLAAFGAQQIISKFFKKEN